MKGQPAGIKKASLIRRIATGAIFAIVVLTCLALGNTFMLLPLLCALLAIVGAEEFYRLTSPDMPLVPRIIGLVTSAALPLAIYFASLELGDLSPILGTGGLRSTVALFYVIICALVGLMMWLALIRDPATRSSSIGRSSMAYVANSLFGALYLGVPFACLLLIRQMNEGSPLLAVALVISVWAADSFAYFGGSLFGRHKIAPQISPKKSWEGLIAGTLGSILFWYLVPYIFQGEASFVGAVVVGSIVSLTALVGDLFQSRLKRERGVKDSGKLLPGHGGILDRIDSLLLTSPVMFVLLSTLGVALGIVIH
ncbi:MAG: phosphatidate cytidylyltransferase [Coriobacteriia bacterium]|nr:phosphatidate cytidylyltransferase [Coriobacteriia bacterium]